MQDRGYGDLTEKLFRFGEELAYVVVLSTVWIVISLPIITIPAATAAVYGTISTHILDGSKKYVEPFKRAFLGAFRMGTLKGLAILVIVGLTILNVFYYRDLSEDSALANALSVVQACLGAFLLALFCVYMIMLGLFFARGRAGNPPGLRDCLDSMKERPSIAVILGALAIAGPAVIGVLSLWQFVIFVVGAVCYCQVWLLARRGWSEFTPEW